MTRRANGEGSIYQRSDGRWTATVTVDGKRTSIYAKTRPEAKAKLKAALERVEQGKPVKDAEMTVATWLTKWRETTLAASSRKASTKTLYSYLATKHLEPEPFGEIKLAKLKPSDIDALVLVLRARGLSESTTRQAYTVLRGAMADAVRDGLLARNVVALVPRPGVAKQDAHYLEPADVAKLLKSAKPSRLWPCFALVAATGIRRGEALALRWSNLDLEEGSIKVSGTLSRIAGELVVTTPKTTRSRRTIPLTPETVAMLKAHRKVQAAERLRAGSEWIDGDYVFPTETGTPTDPRNCLRALVSAADRAGLTDVGVHTLRHSFATAALREKVDPVTLSEILGHSDVSITLNVYGHTSPASTRAAVTAVGAAFGL